MIEVKSIEEITKRVKDYRAIRDQYIEEFSKNNVNEVSAMNYRIINIRLDELSWVLTVPHSEFKENDDSQGMGETQMSKTEGMEMTGCNRSGPCYFKIDGLCSQDFGTPCEHKDDSESKEKKE